MIEIKAVLFDYGMVLSAPPLPSAWARMLAITGQDEARFHPSYWAPRHDYDRGTFTGEEYWIAVGKENLAFEGAANNDFARLLALVGNGHHSIDRRSAILVEADPDEFRLHVLAVLLGQGPACTVRLSDTTVSRRHAAS